MDAALLPPLFAAGTLGNTRDAYSSDPALEQAAKDLVALLDAGDLNGFMAGFEGHLLDWAGLRSADSQARGVFVDARHVAFLEAWYGTGFAAAFLGVDAARPDAPDGAALEAAWLDLYETLAMRFIAASPQASADLAGTALDPAHPFADVAPMAAGRTGAAPELGGTATDAAADAAALAGSGALSADEAVAMLRLLRHDLGTDAASWFAALDTTLAAETDQVTAVRLRALLDAGYSTETPGTPGSDTVTGTIGDDAIFGGPGDDTLSGGEGADTYVYAAGDGADVIDDGGTSARDRVVVQGYSSAATTFSASGTARQDLVLSFGGGDSLTIMDGLSVLSSVASLQFDGEAAMHMEDIRALVVSGQATSGNDDIVGSTGDDTLEGGAGNDTLDGGIGNDTYRFAAGDGQDVIDEPLVHWNTDRLEISGHSASSTVFARGTDPDDLLITFQGSSDSITILDGFLDGASYAIEEVAFADGTVLTMADMAAALVSAQQTSSDDLIRGTNRADTLEGGAGNDTLEGAEAGDTYRFSAGDGVDEIRDVGFSGHDALHLFGYAADQVRFHYGDPETNDIVVSFFDSSDEIVIRNQLLPEVNVPIESVVVNGSDVFTAAQIEAAARLNDETDQFTLIGSAGNDTLEGTEADEVLWGRLGDDFLSGKNGSDTYRFAAGDGHDHISDGGSSGSDTLAISGYAPASVILNAAGSESSDLLITFMGTSSDAITIDHGYAYQDSARIENITFHDGTIWGEQEIHNKIIANQATDGDDVVSGTDRKEVLSGGLGNDTLHGYDGDDTYTFARGDGDDVIEDKGHFQSHRFDQVVIEGYNSDEVTLSPSDGTLLLTFFDPLTAVETGDSVTIVNTLNGSRPDQIKQISFSDGTILDVAAYRQRSVDDQASDSDDVITGSIGAESITGGLGNDTLHGGDGDDTYVFVRGDGEDVIDDNGHFQSHRFDRVVIEGYTPEEVRLTPSGNNLVMTFFDAGSGGPTGDKITIIGTVVDSIPDRIEEISFLDGPTWDLETYRLRMAADQAGDGNDLITGSSGSETLAGGRGNDTLHGGDGSDTYIFFQGDGRDVIEDNGTRWNHRNDKLVIYGYDPSQARFSSSHVTLTIDFMDGDGSPSNDRITIRNTLKGDTYDRIEEIVFGDTGTVLSFSAYRQRAINDQSTDGNDVIMGSPGNDRFEGGLGNDTLHGREGNDTYVFNRGDGHDRIDENGHFQQHQFDQLVINGYTSDEVRLSPSGSSLILTFVDAVTGQLTGDKVTLVDSLNGSRHDQIEQISFTDDGTVWGVGSYRQRSVDDQSTDGDDVIIASTGGERLEGGLGNDTLHGDDGNDTYVFNRGDGQDTIDDNGHFQQHHFDRIIINGYSASEVSLSSSGHSLIMTFIDDVTAVPTGDSIFIRDTLNGSRPDQIEEISFAVDGTVWDVNAYKQALSNPAGTTGANTLNASSDSGWPGDETLTIDDPGLII